jgi:YidC/Oxa1 family membrane protein insertase
MDFGIGFLSNNIMLPILDFFYGIVPSYGLAIVALTLVIRFALYPLNAGSIRNMRRMKVAQPLMQKRVKEIQDRYKDDPAKLQEEMGKVYKEFGNPLAGCFPVLLQMPILFALFATLRGSPFADINYDVNLDVFPQEKIEQIQPQIFSTSPKTIYVSDGAHFPISAVIPGGNKLVVGETTDIRLQSSDGQPIDSLVAAYTDDTEDFQPQWTVTKGEEFVKINDDGTVTALAPGAATIKAEVPGLAANKGFLFIKALGRVGVTGDDGAIHWDILLMVLTFGGSLYLNQVLSGQGSTSDNPQQNAVNKFTPLIFLRHVSVLPSASRCVDVHGDCQHLPDAPDLYSVAGTAAREICKKLLMQTIRARVRRIRKTTMIAKQPSRSNQVVLRKRRPRSAYE